MTYNIQSINKSLHKLSEWIENYGWEGIDYYDIIDNKFFHCMNKRKLTYYIELAMLDLFPQTLNYLFAPPKKINAKAMGLLCEGYVDGYLAVNDEDNLRKAIKCANWLLENNSKSYTQMCWGYPFNWASKIMIKAGTPSGVVTSQVINALLKVYDITKQEKYLAASVSACEFFFDKLNITRFNDKEICFSYTPLDNEMVYNASILVAASIYKTNLRDKGVPTELAMKAVRFVKNNQEDDGSWRYFHPREGRIDPYHTGFIIRALYEIYLINKDPEILVSINRGINYFINNLLTNKTIPVDRAGRKYPVDIHSCAEGIMMLATLSEINLDYLEIAKKVADWTIKYMQDNKGYFYYRKYPGKRVKIVYFRWSQAWMFLALNRLRYNLIMNNQSENNEY